MNHVRMIAAEFLIYEKNINKLNVVHNLTSKNILADKIFMRYDFPTKFRRFEKFFRRWIVNGCKHKKKSQRLTEEIFFITKILIVEISIAKVKAVVERSRTFAEL